VIDYLNESSVVLTEITLTYLSANILQQSLHSDCFCATLHTHPNYKHVSMLEAMQDEAELQRTTTELDETFRDNASRLRDISIEQNCYGNSE